jgi:hypothetical protein
VFRTSSPFWSSFSWIWFLPLRKKLYRKVLRCIFPLFSHNSLRDPYSINPSNNIENQTICSLLMTDMHDQIHRFNHWLLLLIYCSFRLQMCQFDVGKSAFSLFVSMSWKKVNCQIFMATFFGFLCLFTFDTGPFVSLHSLVLPCTTATVSSLFVADSPACNQSIE